MRVISFLAQETRDTVAINYVSSTIETVIHQTPGDEGSLATKPTYEYVQLFSGQSSDGSPRLRQSQVRRPRPFGSREFHFRDTVIHWFTQYGTKRRP